MTRRPTLNSFCARAANTTMTRALRCCHFRRPPLHRRSRTGSGNRLARRAAPRQMRPPRSSRQGGPSVGNTEIRPCSNSMACSASHMDAPRRPSHRRPLRHGAMDPRRRPTGRPEPNPPQCAAWVCGHQAALAWHRTVSIRRSPTPAIAARIRPQLTVYCPIMPLSSCSRMWQWYM